MRSEIALELLNEKELAHQHFMRVLQMAYCNPMMTEETLLQRRLLKDTLYPLNYSYIPGKFYNFHTGRVESPKAWLPVAFMFGSGVGGRCIKGSDTDYKLYSEVANEILKPDFRADRIPNTLGDFEIDLLENGTLLPREVAIFLPALGEFDNYPESSQIRDTTHELRKKIIMVLETINPRAEYNAPQIWNMMRKMLNMLVFPNSTSRIPPNSYDDFGEPLKDRQKRLERYWKEVIDRYDGRANRFKEKFEVMSYPDWETMKQAYL